MSNSNNITTTLTVTITKLIKKHLKNTYIYLRIFIIKWNLSTDWTSESNDSTFDCANQSNSILLISFKLFDYPIFSDYPNFLKN